jgi:hypothetical protein
MKLDRRFVFHGTAVAFGGHIVRPVDLALEPSCAASLPTRGGRSTSQRSGGNFGGVRFGSAYAHAEGVFDDFHQAVELTYGRVEEHTLTTTTRVTAAVDDVVIGGRPALAVKRIRGTLVSNSAAGGDETPILLIEDTVADGVTIDGHALQVDLNVPMFQKLRTRANLVAAGDDPQFVRDHGACFFFPERGAIHATIVKSLRWRDAPHPDSQLDHHCVTVPNLGRIFFGEVLITESARRLTMMRVELGSAADGPGGHIAFAEIDAGGVWYLPAATTTGRDQ